MAAADNSQERIDRTENYAAKIQRQFSATVNAILKLHKSLPKLEEGQMYSFDGQNARIRREADKLLRELNSVVQLAIKKGIEVEWEAAEKASKELLQKTMGKDNAAQALKLTTDAARNAQAMQQFINRSDNGMNLSGRVWRTCQQLRDELEVALTVAIGEGRDAASMSRKVRKYLNDPDLMFRRFRYKDENGEWQRKWKKKVIEDGKTKWIDYDRDSYKTGAGVYKSAARNAMRVARTETNIAYRNSDTERWSTQDFVIGQRISLSKSHPPKPEHELCEKLAGDYPKDFVFDGWHPQCFCVMTPIFAPESELRAWNKAMAKGEEYEFKTKPIKDYPANFKEWVTKNRDSILAKRQAGTEAYFTKHNKAAINKLLGLSTGKADSKPTIKERAEARHAARTPEQVKAIQKAWDQRQKAMHSLDPIIKDPTFKNIEYNEVAPLAKELTSVEIIKRLSGGDKTDGSCSSLALAYAANRYGLDVLDFRGGTSRSAFADRDLITCLCDVVGGIRVRSNSCIKNAKNLLAHVEEGKEYYFTSGRHAAIVRKVNNHYEYLELQSPTPSHNKFKTLAEYSLRDRFKAGDVEFVDGRKVDVPDVLIDIDLLAKQPQFKQMMGYVNTPKKKQLKGKTGKIH